MNHLDAGHHVEQIAGQMNRRPDARRRKIDLARSDPGIGDELGNGMDRSERTVRGLCRRIGSFVPTFSRAECRNYFRHAGYRHAGYAPI